MPQLALNIPHEVKKVVVKVRTDFVVESKKAEEIPNEEPISQEPANEPI